MSGGKSSGRHTLAETKTPFPTQPRSLTPSKSAKHSSRPNALSQAQSPTLLVLASTFPKSRADSTPAFVLDLSKHLQSWFQVTVLAPAVRCAPDRDEIEGVQVRRFHYVWPRFLERLADGAILENVRRSRWLYLLAPLLFLFELIAAYKWARKTRPAVIHAHWFIPQGIVAVLVGRLLGIPVVVTAHGGDITGLRGWPWSVVRKVVAARSRAITVVSSDLQRRLGGVASAGGRPPLVMPMGVDTKRFRADPRSRLPAEKTVLFVGRLAEKKGLEYLIKAFPEVLSRHRDACLQVVGDGPLRDDLERLASHLGLGDQVQFVGRQPSSDVPGWYSRCRVFLLPSVVARSGDMEGLPVVLLEAMAAGRPVVATSVGGIPEVVIHRRTGLLVEPESHTALARAINELLDSQAAAEKMGEVARRWVRRKFDWRQVGQRYANLLTQAARRGE